MGKIEELKGPEELKNWQKAMSGNPTVILLGNGFDLALGFNTSYKDFYESHEFNILTSDLAKYIKKSKEKGLKNWSDLEALLSEYSVEVKDNEKLLLSRDNDGSVFKKEFEELKTALFIYI